MCGIAGAVFWPDQAASTRFAEAAPRLLAHRGPDDTGAWVFPEGCLVHRRLSILDVSSAGRQPFCSRDGSVRLVYNGEIYNYLELREELRGLGHAFTSDTDTEVLVASYLEWGPDCVERFNGIWAFALWDGPARRVLLSRDRLGVKPLFYVRKGAGIAFASEIKAIRSILPSVQPNIGALRDYSWLALVDHSDQTFYDGIESLSPGEYLSVCEQSTQRFRYWSLPAPRDEDARRDPRDQLVDFGGVARDAIRLQLRADVPLGSCLSGGVDSSFIVATSSELVRESTRAHQAPPRVALTASFPGSDRDETARAAEVARHAGVDHVAVALRPGDIVDTLREVLSEQDEPFLSASILAQRAVMEAASSRGIKVMLDGQGADEMLGGYPHYRYPWLLTLMLTRPFEVPGALRSLRRFGMSPAVALRQAVLSSTRLGSTDQPRFGHASRPEPWIGPVLRAADPLHVRPEAVRATGTPLRRHLARAVVATSLPALLRYEDRSSMRFGVEARVPFLDHRLVENAFRLSDTLKIDHGWTKVALRKASSGHVPEAILRDRRKIGFAVPQATWLADAMPRVRGIFETSIAASEGLFDRDGLTALTRRPLGPDDGAQLWRALSVELWLRSL